MSRDSVLFTCLAALTLALVTATVNRYVPGNHPLCGDEEHFVKTVRSFGEGFTWEKLRTYEEMSTPLPFLVYAAWGRLFGFDLSSLRWCNCLVGWLACLAVYRLACVARLTRGERWLVAGWFLAVPYTPYLSAFVHTDMLAVAMLVCGLSSAVGRRWIVAGLWLAGAILCRQYLVFAAMSVAGYGVWRAARRGDGGARASAVLAAVVAVAPTAVLFAYWGGPHPANQMHHLYMGKAFVYHPESLAVYLAVLPVYLAPFFARGLVRTPPNRWELACAIAAGSIVIFAPLGPSEAASAAGIETIGLFHRLMRLAGSHTLEQAVFGVGMGLSSVAAIRLARRYVCGGPAVDDYVLWDLTTVGFFAIMPLSYLHWEKYLFPLIPVLAVRMADRPLLTSAEPPPSPANGGR